MLIQENHNSSPVQMRKIVNIEKNLTFTEKFKSLKIYKIK